jgi:hypothetical protein
MQGGGARSERKRATETTRTRRQHHITTRARLGRPTNHINRRGTLAHTRGNADSTTIAGLRLTAHEGHAPAGFANG